MQITLFGKQRPVWTAVLAVVALTALLYAQFLLLFNRELVLLSAVAMALLFARGDLRRLWNLPSVLLLGYIVYTAASACWAAAGKFFLIQFEKLFLAALVFVALVLHGRAEKTFARRVMAVIADVSALLALMSVEGATTGLLQRIVFDWLDVGGIHMAFTGSRLYGAFGNSNVEASVFALGVFFSLPLLQEAESRRERALRAAALAFNAFAFVLVFSMGAIACFAAAVVVYLIVSGKQRGRVLALMLSAAAPTLIAAFASTRFFNASGVLKLVPFLLMLLDAAAITALDEKFGGQLGKALAAHEKALYGTLLALVALLAVYVVLALRLSAPYTFGGSLFRSMPVAPGEHTLQIDADGPVEVSIVSKNSMQVMVGEPDTLYTGAAGDAVFAVPEDSVEVRFTFDAGEGVTFRSARIDGETTLMLRYRLLPDFIANRLQGTLSTSNSVILRVMLWQVGLRYWRTAPVFGHGMGSFESGLFSVLDFDYETKFPHNHYIQALLEGGVIGFALFFGALIALGAALWKRRRVLCEGDLAALYGAFAAEFVMNALQMIWDISMTNTPFLCGTYAFYALLVLLCAEPLGKKAELPEAPGAGKPGKKRKGAARPKVRPEIRAACVLLPAFVGVTFLGNIIAQHLLYDLPESREMYLSNVELAVKFDLFEYNDAYATYITQVMDSPDLLADYIPQADKYAERLASRPSNSSARFLAQYYLNTGRYSMAVDAALRGVRNYASSTKAWNNIIDLFKQAFANTSVYSPVLSEDGLLDKLLAYRAAWVTRCQTALAPIALTAENARFFDELLDLEACGGNTEQMAAVLYQYQPNPQNVEFE